MPSRSSSTELVQRRQALEITTDELEAHFLAGGRITNVVRSMIAADKAKNRFAMGNCNCN